MAADIGLNMDLLTQSLNYHGSELTSLIKGFSVFQELDPKKLNYQVYGKRSKDLVDGRTQRTAIHQFIGSKLGPLFTRQYAPRTDEDRICEQPPPLLDMWMGEKTLDYRNDAFFKKVQVGDVLFCKPFSHVPGGTVFDVLAHMSDQGRVNFAGDLKLRVMLPTTEMYADLKPPFESICKLCVIDGLDRVKPVVTLKWSSVPRQARFLEQKTELGIVHERDLPFGLREFLRHPFPFKNVIEKMESFRCPTGIQEMAAGLGIPFQAGAWSLCDGLAQGKYPPEVTADGIERAQNGSMAKHLHSKGIEFYEKNENFEAHQCFSQALLFDPNHVESLFARGSLYANEKKYPKAFDDLKGALRLDPKHQSCIDYTTKVLKILAASLLKSDKLDEAVKLCDCVLEIIPDNQSVLTMKKEILSYKEDSSTDSKDSDEELRQSTRIDYRSKNPEQERPSRNSNQTQIIENGANILEVEKRAYLAPGPSTDASIISSHSFHPHHPISSSQYPYGMKGQPLFVMPPVVPRVESEHERACREFLEKTKTKRRISSRSYGSSSPERSSYGKSKYRKSPGSYRGHSKEKRSLNERYSRDDAPLSRDDKSRERKKNEDRRSASNRSPERYDNQKYETSSKRDRRSRSSEYKKRKRDSSTSERYEENSRRESVTKKEHSSLPRTSSKQYRRSRSRSVRSDLSEKKPSKSSKSEKQLPSQVTYVWEEKEKPKKSKKKKSKKKSSNQDDSSDEYDKSPKKKKRKFSSEDTDQSTTKKRRDSDSSDYERQRRKKKKYSRGRRSRDRSEDSANSTPEKLKQWKKSTQDINWMTKKYNGGEKDSNYSTKRKKPQEFSRSFSPNALKAFEPSDDEEDEHITRKKK